MAIEELGDSRALHECYVPLPKQLAFHESAAKYRLQVGGAGSGKSLALLWEALLHYTVQFPGCRVLLLRKNFPELEKGLIRDLFDTVPRKFFDWNDQKHIATFAVNGQKSQIFFGHCEGGSERSLAQYLSSAFVYIGMDEMGQFSYAAWDFLKGRNRVNAGCRVNVFGQMPDPRMAGATNPMGPGWGWIKSLWVDRRAPSEAEGASINFDDYVYFHSTVLDNRILLERDPRYLESLKGLAPDLRRKFLDGDLNSISGQYFYVFDPGRHVIDLEADPKRIEWQPWQSAWIGLDFGIAHHTAVLWLVNALLRGFDGKYSPATIVYREFAIRQCSPERLAALIAGQTDGGSPFKSREEEIKQIRHVFASHELFARRTDPSPENTLAAVLSRELRRYALPPLAKAAGSASASERTEGAQVVYTMLSKGTLAMLSSCAQLARAIPLLARDERDIEDVVKTSGIEDDLFDALKHGILSTQPSRKKPLETIVEEHATTIEDPLARWLYLTKHKQQRRRGAAVPSGACSFWENYCNNWRKSV